MDEEKVKPEPWFRVAKLYSYGDIHELRLFPGVSIYPCIVVRAHDDAVFAVYLRRLPKLRTADEARRFVEMSNDIISWMELAEEFKRFKSLSELALWLVDTGLARKR